MKKWITVLLSLMMVLSLAACGGADDEGGMENEDSTVEAEEDAAEELESVKSAGGMIEVTPLEDWEVDIYSSCEDMIIRAPGTEEGTGHDKIEIACGNAEVSCSQDTFGWEPGTGYTMADLKVDIEAEIESGSSHYSNPTEVTVGDYGYIRCDVVINAQDSYRYFAVVDDAYCVVSVVGGDILGIDSDDAKAMMESIVFGEYQEP